MLPRRYIYCLITINVPVVYMGRDVPMDLDGKMENSITRALEGVGPEIWTF